MYLTLPPEVAGDAGEDGILRIVPGQARVWIGEPGNAVHGVLEFSGQKSTEVDRPWALRTSYQHASD